MEYKEHFYPPTRNYVEQLQTKKDEKETDQILEPSIVKKQKLSETEENILLKSTSEIGQPPETPLDIDIIIDDAFMKNLKKPEHKEIFKTIDKMIETMENLNEEDEEIL